jgi:hypothetical protein
MVNTIQKVDKLLSEKPKTKYITKRFTEEEIDYLLDQLYRVEDLPSTPRETKLNDKLKNKLK